MATPETNSPGFVDANDENQAPAIVESTKNTTTTTTSIKNQEKASVVAVEAEDDMSAVSVQSARSLKDTIKIVAEDIQIVEGKEVVEQDQATEPAAVKSKN